EPIRSFKVVRGHFATWRNLIECPLRHRWLDGYAERVDLTVPGKPAGNGYGATPSMLDEWNRTFRPHMAHRRPSDTSIPTPTDTPIQRVSIPAAAAAAAAAEATAVDLAAGAAHDAAMPLGHSGAADTAPVTEQRDPVSAAPDALGIEEERHDGAPPL